MMKKLFAAMLLMTAFALGANGQETRFAGGDISLLPSYEQVNTPYLDRSGAKINDLVTYVHDVCHWNSCRVRLFVDPVIINADGTKQGEVQDLEYATALCRRIKDAGMNLLLDFHYSDTWADPVKQAIPRAWQSLTEEQLLDTMYGYTKMCLETMVAAGATPDFIQIGNEISYGMLWRGSSNSTQDKVHASNEATYQTETAQWTRFGNLLKNAGRAVREVCPEAKIVIHIERTANASMCNWFYTFLERQNVDYDVIGLSYYPFWHGWLDHELHNTLTVLHNNFPTKPIQIVETAYYNNWWPSSGVNYNTSTQWAASAAGQAAYLRALIDKLEQYDFVDGLYYWFPEENGCGGATWSESNIVINSWLNRGLFNPDNHKAYEGLYLLADFISDGTELENVGTADADGIIYSLLGQPLGTDLNALPTGTYIRNHRVVIR